jgi:hypothetical protein
MDTGETHIGRATEADLDGIVELQAANQADRGGTLSASMPRGNLASLRAHEKMGMREVGGFGFGGLAFSVLAYMG